MAKMKACMCDKMQHAGNKWTECIFALETIISKWFWIQRGKKKFIEFHLLKDIPNPKGFLNGIFSSPTTSFILLYVWGESLNTDIPFEQTQQSLVHNCFVPLPCDAPDSKQKLLGTHPYSKVVFPFRS